MAFPDTPTPVNPFPSRLTQDKDTFDAQVADFGERYLPEREAYEIAWAAEADNVRATALAGDLPALTGFGGQVLGVSGDEDAATFKHPSEVGPVRNEVINGCFDVWQRGTSFTGLSDFGPDRFVFNGGNVSRQEHDGTQGVIPGNPRYFMRIEHPVAANNRLFDYTFDDIYAYVGRTITVNLNCKSVTANPTGLKVQALINYGVGGSGSSLIGFKLPTVTSEFSNTSFTGAVPTLEGVTLGTDPHIELRVVNNANEAWDLDVGSVGLYLGDRKAELDAGLDPQINTDFDTELLRCQRYYTQFFPGMTTGTRYGENGTALAHIHGGSFSVPMRATPTMAWTGFSTQGGATTPNFTVSNRFNYNINTSLNATGTYRIFGGTITADAEFNP